MDYQSFKNAVVAKAEQMGLAEYELYYQASQSMVVNAFGHELEQFNASTEGGVCFRCIVNGRMGYAATEELSREQAAAIVERAADNAAALEAEEPVFLVSGGQSYAPVDRQECALPETQLLIQTVLDTQEKLYQADPAVVDGSTTRGIAEKTTIAICNSKGLDLTARNTVSALVLGAVVSNGEEKANDYQIKLGAPEQIDTTALAAKAASCALAKLGGEPAPTGVYPVVFDPECMSDLLDTFSSVFSAEAAQKGLSRLAEQEGTLIASEVVSLVDDPAHPENPMPMAFDAEGWPTRKKHIIENGRLITLLHNLKTANVAGGQTTGNASKANYDAPVSVEPFTMYLAPGSCTREQLLQQAGEGVYIHYLGGLHAGANPITGDFSLQSEGYLIRNGQKTDHVKGFTVAGNFYQLLKDIVALSDQMQLPAPTGMTTFGSPCVLVKGLSIAGKE